MAWNSQSAGFLTCLLGDLQKRRHGREYAGTEANFLRLGRQNVAVYLVAKFGRKCKECVRHVFGALCGGFGVGVRWQRGGVEDWNI